MSDVADIRRIWPLVGSPGAADTAASDDELADWYAAPDRTRRWARVNFVSSLDGAATHDGVSGGLSNSADKQVFAVLRRLCDVIVVGAGTVRDEGYGAMRLDPASVAWRVARGLPPHPVFAIVSARLDLDAESDVFAKAPVRPLVLTASAAPEDRRAALERVADVVDCGTSNVDTAIMLDRLAERGLLQVHCEGGPHLFGTMIEQGTVDELCLTLSPALEGGSARRITDGGLTAPTGMTLAQVLLSGDTLILRYLRGENDKGVERKEPSWPS